MLERTKNTRGNATPFPHILYSTASEYGFSAIPRFVYRSWLSTLRDDSTVCFLCRKSSCLTESHRSRQTACPGQVVLSLGIISQMFFQGSIKRFAFQRFSGFLPLLFKVKALFQFNYRVVRTELPPSHTVPFLQLLP